MKTILIGMMAALAVTPSLRTVSGNAQAGMFVTADECVGCAGSRTAPFTNSPCITITETVAGACASGTCTGTTAPCITTPCTMTGTFVIAATGAAGCGDIYVRQRDHFGCVGGTTVVVPGGTTNFVYNGDKLDCNKTLMVRVYDTNPGANCIIASDAGFSFTCGECRLTADG